MASVGGSAGRASMQPLRVRARDAAPSFLPVARLAPGAATSSRRWPTTGQRTPAAPARSVPRGPSMASAAGAALLTRRGRVIGEGIRGHHHRGRLVLVASAGGDGGEALDSEASSSDLSHLCQQVSRSFYEACLPQLSVRYEDALKSFAEACKALYVSGASVAAINLQLQMSPKTGNAELDTFLEQRGGLQADEVEMRTSWLSICFVAFEEVAVLRDDVPESGELGTDEARLGVFVRNVVKLAKKGMDAQRVKLTEVLKMSGPENQPRSDTESAVLSQAIRIVFAALEAAEGPTPPSNPPPSPPPASSKEAEPTPASAATGLPRGARFQARKRADIAAKKKDGPGSKFAARKAAEAQRRLSQDDM